MSMVMMMMMMMMMMMKERKQNHLVSSVSKLGRPLPQVSVQMPVVPAIGFAAWPVPLALSAKLGGGLAVWVPDREALRFNTERSIRHEQESLLMATSNRHRHLHFFLL